MASFGIRVLDGTAAAPTLSFGDDTNSGFYREGGDTVALSLGGTKRWSFGTAGSTLTGTLTVSGATTLQSTLAVTGKTTLAGNAWVGASEDIEAWDAATYAVIEGETGALGFRQDAVGVELLANLYYASGAHKYKTSSGGSRVLFKNQTIDFYVVASGTADASATMVHGLEIVDAGSSTSAVLFPTIGTTGSGANAFLNSASSPANSLLRSTSSLRYKEDLRDLSTDEARTVVFGVKPIKYRSLAPADEGREFVGFGAEQVDQVDPRFVNYMDGAPDGVMYDRMTVPLAVLMRDHEERLTRLEKAGGL